MKLNQTLRDIFGTQGEPDHQHVESPLFITGAMRSGTTYLVNKLAAHPQLLKIGSELNQIWTDIGGAPIKGECIHLTRADANPIYTYQMTHYISDYIHRSKSWKRHMMRFAKKGETNLFRVDYDWEHLVPMNKSPHLMNKLGYVHGLFPESKFILIVRDIYAHSASMKHHFLKSGRVRFMPDDPTACWSDFDPKKHGSELGASGIFPPNFKRIPEMWIRLNKIALTEIQQLPEHQYHVIQYEDLITQKAETLTALFAFLSLETAHEAVEEEIKATEAKKRNTSTKGDPLTKWKETLSLSEVKEIDEAIAEHQTDYDEIVGMLGALKAI